MSQILQRALDAGWRPERLPAPGVPGGFTPPSDEGISFPDDGFGGVLDSVSGGAWLDHRAIEILRVLNRQGVSGLWEVGAGNGFVAVPLQRAGIDVVAVEPLSRAAGRLSRRDVPVFEATLEGLHLPPGVVPAIGAFDVLEHLPHPDVVVAEMYRVLEPGGFAVITVPAGQWLWGDLDDAVGHFRRYSKRLLRRTFVSCGFEVVEVRSLYFSLVFPAAVGRALPYRLGRRNRSASTLAARDRQLASDGLEDRVMGSLLRAERAVGQRISFPIGLTLLGVFRRPR